MALIMAEKERGGSSSGVESQGKMKKKDLDISLTVEEVGTGNGDELQGKTKKKKKRESTSPVTVEDIDVAENDESQRKKRKKKNLDTSLTVEEAATGNGDELQGKTEKKKKKKRESTSPVTVEEVETGNGDELQGETEKKKKKKKMKRESTSPVTVEDVDVAGNGCGDESQGKRKKKKKNLNISLTVEEVGSDELQGKKEKKRKKRESTPPVQSVDEAADESQRKKRKKKNLTTSQTVEDCGPGTESAMKKTVLVTQELQTGNGGESIRKTKKKVSFQLPDSTQDDPPENEVPAEETEMNHTFKDLSALWATDRLRPDLVWGMYTPEEDEALKQAVFDYIKEQGWEQEYGLQKIMNSKNGVAKGCWHTIRKCLPQREIKRLHARAHRLFDPGNYLGKWTAEETQSLIELHSVHGNDWKKISTIIGRDANNVKDKWRTLKSGDQKTGPWAPEEQQKLRALVLKCLHVRRQMAKKGLLKKHHKVVRDEINWEFIAEQMEGRNRLNCMAHWYKRMASSMVTTGQWSNGDDQRLLERLMEEFPLSEDLVEWDSLLENRSGEVCKKRWDQMQRCCGKQSTVRHLHFLEKLENLIKVFAPHLLDTEYDQQFAADLQRADSADADESDDDANT